MAARKSSADIPETDTSGDDLEGGEALEGTDLPEEIEETSLDEAFADEDDDELATNEVLGDEDDPAELTATPVAEGAEEADAAESDIPAPAGASFDDEDADEEIVAAVTGEDDDQEIEGLREGEFVCRSCFMAKRDTQLADPEQLLCRDCA